MRRVLLIGLSAALGMGAQEYTRGVGVYPGNPAEYSGPAMVTDATTYRNLALHRPAYQSSSYDYNLTAQLVTDGIKDTRLPRWVSTSASERGALSKQDRESVLDRNLVTGVELRGPHPWVEVGLEGGDGAPEVDRLDVFARPQGFARDVARWTCTVSGSDGERTWKELARKTGAERAARDYQWSIALAAPSRSRFYRVAFEAPNVQAWRANEVAFYDRNERLGVGGPYEFTSAWMSAGSGEEWVYVDLGARCTFDRVALYWIRRAAEGSIQVSDDAVAWRTVAPLSAVDDVKLAQPAHGRYVRVLMTRPASPVGYILSELEVYGRGGPAAKAKPVAAGLGAWRLQRDSLVQGDGEQISQPGYQDKDWMIATVPGTTLTSYLNDGAVPDPNYGDNQLLISDSFFYADFWYRDKFVAPAVAKGRHVWLNFDGINWKADVFLNGAKVGRIEGAFMRGRFDVTDRIRAGAVNAVAVRIEKNATPGSVKEKGLQSDIANGGALGADNPTYHASIGWDWMSTIRGRDTGIWAGVYLSESGPVKIEDPFVTTTLPLPETSRAEVTIEATLRNLEGRPVSGKLSGHFGETPFETMVALDGAAVKTVKVAVALANPKLWWPNGYGDPYLYPVELRFEQSDAVSFQAGVRQFTYSEDGGALKIRINGRRFIARGGNWGFAESMLRYRARDFESALRYHRDLHFNMIRDWVGQVADNAFYEASDRNGIVVWQDFWLANPWDGPDPDDDAMFLANARDTMLRIRNHPSLGLYCGRNEGNPPKALDDGLRALQAELHPGMHYISNSAHGVVSGEGPYRVEPRPYYFANAPVKLHSEMGSPDVPVLESLRAMMPRSALWPQSGVWPLHDFDLHFVSEIFHEAVDRGYGGAGSLADWVSLAQFVDYDAYRGMFEGQSKDRMGLLIWMSHSAWPSLLWQTYDYYFDPAAGYFGAKKACEPLHIQWNPVTDMVEVVNDSAGEERGLAARVEIRNMDGSLRWEKTATLDSAEDSTASPIRMEYPAGLSATHFIRLSLAHGDEMVSTNFYLRGVREGDYRAIRELPPVKLEAATRVERQGTRWLLTTELRNASQAPALMVRVKAVRETSGDRILPALYSDNYVALMPGERRTIRTELEHADTRGERPRIVVEGFNVR
ncbi:MAG: discoidin domain-containing protein [Bryobacteraceae bacterium]